jgi:hypothetical protein
MAEVAADLPLDGWARVEYCNLFHGPNRSRHGTREQQDERRVREASGQARAIRWERRLQRV